MTDSNKKNVSQPVTTQALVFDVLEIAEKLEDIVAPLAGSYPPGIYLPDSLEPVLVPGGTYFYEMFDQPQTSHEPFRSYRYVPVGDLQVAMHQPWDILDAPEGNVVVTHAQLRVASEAPKLPARGLKLIQDIVFNTVFSPLAHGDYPKLDKIDVVKKHIDVSANFNNLEPNYKWMHLNSIVDKIYSNCADLLRHIHAFIGEKGMYAMYDLNFHTSTTLSLVYTGDFRIADWHRRMGEGSWV